MEKIVSFISHSGYERTQLIASIRRAIKLSGFDLNSTRGKNVLIKPNMLGAYPPSAAITTHPEFVAATCVIFLDAGAIVSVGDAQSGIESFDATFVATGIKAACESVGVELSNFEASGNVIKNGLTLARAPLEADILINIPKFKTHGLTLLTLAAKNLYGCINGMQKVHLHRLFSNPADFADLIVRIGEAVRPELTIIDGIVGMDGNGPSSGGNPIDLGIIVAGTDVHAIDAACCTFIGIDPTKLPTLAAAANIGVWNPSDDIRLTGDPIESIKPNNFRLPTTFNDEYKTSDLFQFIVRNYWKIANRLATKPMIAKERCKRCSICEKVCPVVAIKRNSTNSFPRIDHRLCIHCLCCHERCPHGAIDIRVHPIIRLFSWIAMRKLKREN